MALRSTWFLASALATTAAIAHHSVPVNFDQSREIVVAGVLTEIKWLNPHSQFRMDVTDDNGTTVEWLVEMGSVNAMRRSGFERELYDIGTAVSVIGWPGRRERVIFFNRALVRDGEELRCVATPGRVEIPCEPRTDL